MACYSDFWFDFIDQKHFFNQTRDGESDILLYNSFLELHYLHYKMGKTSKTSNKRNKKPTSAATISHVNKPWFILESI